MMSTVIITIMVKIIIVLMINTIMITITAHSEDNDDIKL